MKIKVNEQWNNERLTPALLQWRSGSAREKAKSIVLELLQLQRECGKHGVKNLLGQPVVSVSSRMVSAFYHDYASQKKFIHWVVQSGLVVKDRHWINNELAKELNRETRCDSWHITEPKSGKKVEVSYDENAGMFSIYKKSISKAEGTQVDDAHFYHGEWALTEYTEGNLTWSDFIEVGKAAHNVLKGRVRKGVSCRVFDCVSLCKKELRGRCFTDADGNESKEVFDIPGAVTFTAPLAMAAFSLSSFSDKDVCNWAFDLAVGSSKDPYKRIWNKVYDIDRNTNAYGSEPKWTKGTRKTVKMDVQCIANSDIQYLQDGKQAYFDFFNNPRKVNLNKRRQWLLWNAIVNCNKPFATAIAATKESGIKDAFYRLHTFGEKMVMGVLIKELGKMGIVVHRVHDALWTADKRLTSLTETQMDSLVGKIILRFFKDCKDGYGRKGILKMVKESGLTRQEAEWVWETLVSYNVRRQKTA